MSSTIICIHMWGIFPKGMLTQQPNVMPGQGFRVLRCKGVMTLAWG